MTDIVLDTSRSMTTDGNRKAERALELTATLFHLALQANADPVIWFGAERRRFAALEEFSLDDTIFNTTAAVTSVIEEAAARFRRRSLRYVISDYLFEHDPEMFVRLTAEGASALGLIQVLAPGESKPDLRGGHRLVDVESDEELNMTIGRREVDSYLRRLGRLQYALARAARRARGVLVVGTSDRPLDAWCREELWPAGVLEAQ